MTLIVALLVGEWTVTLTNGDVLTVHGAPQAHGDGIVLQTGDRLIFCPNRLVTKVACTMTQPIQETPRESTPVRRRLAVREMQSKRPNRPVTIDNASLTRFSESHRRVRVDRAEPVAVESDAVQVMGRMKEVRERFRAKRNTMRGQIEALEADRRALSSAFIRAGSQAERERLRAQRRTLDSRLGSARRDLAALNREERLARGRAMGY